MVFTSGYSFWINYNKFTTNAGIQDTPSSIVYHFYTYKLLDQQLWDIIFLINSRVRKLFWACLVILAGLAIWWRESNQSDLIAAMREIKSSHTAICSITPA